jgi:sulfofructose kinase
MTAARVVCIGVATLDTIVEVERLPGADDRVPARDGRLAGGGVAATAAVTLARLGIPVAFVGCVGDDAAGRWIRDGLGDEGVEVRGLHVTSGRSPVSAVLIEQGSGGRALAPYPGEGGPIELSGEDFAMCAAAEWIHLDHVGHAVLASLWAARLPARISFDGGVPVQDLTLAGIDLYAPTEAALLASDPGRLLDDAMAAALDEGPSAVVVSRGAQGSVALERNLAGRGPRRTEAAAFPIDAGAGSTLGAGDVFHGALVAALVEGRSMAEALERANACAALACRAIDGRSAIPTAEALDRFIAGQAGKARVNA